MNEKEFIIDKFTFEVICEYIDGIKDLNNMFLKISNQMPIEAINENLKDIEEKQVNDASIFSLLHACEGFSEEIEESLDLLILLNKKVQRQLNDAKCWL